MGKLGDHFSFLNVFLCNALLLLPYDVYTRGIHAPREKKKEDGAIIVEFGNDKRGLKF